jgi:hypothetical protein
MSYYNPNFYSGYPQYSNPYVVPQTTTYSNPQSVTAQPVVSPQPQIQQPAPALNGKMVDGIDMVKATEVPLGGYGIYPKADLNEIYVKTWNNNGTTNIITYKPSIEEIPKEEEDSISTTQIMEKINRIEEKIDSILNVPKTIVKKEVK